LVAHNTTLTNFVAFRRTRVAIGGTNMRRTIMALLLLLNGAAVAAAQPVPASPDTPKPTAAKQAPAKQVQPQNGNCVGVVSHLGETFALKKIGITAFGNEENKASVGSWHIDDLVAAKISGFLGKRIAVRRIPYKRDAFASLDSPKLFRNPDADFGEIIRTIAAGSHCARYVAVTAGGGAFGATNQSLSGLGIVAKNLISGYHYYLYTLIAVRVYDGETFSLLTSKYAPSEQSALVAIIRGPYREVDESLWPVTPDAAAQNAKLRDAVRELVAKGLDATLPELKLTE
jgi:hypothetical protein